MNKEQIQALVVRLRTCAGRISVDDTIAAAKLLEDACLLTAEQSYFLQVENNRLREVIRNITGDKEKRPQYACQRDRDAKGFFYWILDPNGNRIAYVEEQYLAHQLVRHLNRERN